MRITRAAIKLHKWLALIVGIQIVLWFASGFFMAHFPIEDVRGEDQIRDAAPATLGPASLSPALGDLIRLHGIGATRLEVRPVLGRPVLLVDRPEAPQLFDAATGKHISPIPASLAVEIAAADYAGPGKAKGALLVTEESTEYRGPLPAWRVDFSDPRNTSLYVAAQQARVTARRTDLWRTYDFLWGLHITDWKEHENFNSWWLWLASAAALIAALTGIIMLPNSFRRLWRRRGGSRQT